jgi:hypothetical protein
MSNTFLVKIVVSIVVDTDDAESAAEYAESLLYDDDYTIDDVIQPLIWNPKTNEWDATEQECK